MDPVEEQYQQAIEQDDIPGAVVVAENTARTFNYVKQFGQRTLLDGSQKPLEASDVLALYSCTKIITSIAVMQCLNKGLFTLDEDISRVLPFFATVQVLAGIEEGKPILEEKKQPVTLRLLLTHSSGARYEQMDPRLMQWRAHHGPMLGDAEGTVVGRYDLPLSFQPGTSWGYGPGLDWAGKAVEIVTGMSLGDYFQKNIFDQLGVRNASFFPMKSPAMRALMVDLNPSDPEGHGIAPLAGFSSQVGVRDCFGGQGIWMPATEHLKILHSLLANDGKVLPPETVETMFKPHLKPEAHAALNALINSEAEGSPLTGGVKAGSRCDYGLSGLLVDEDLPGWYAAGTLTWGGALNTTWFVDRRSGLCGLGSPQMHLRDAPFLRGEGYEFKPHREGAMRWEDTAAHYKQVFRQGIYRAYDQWKGQH